MERLVSLNVPNLDSGTGGDIRDIVIVPVGVWVTVCRSVHNAEVIVVITVRIEGDLLLCNESISDELRHGYYWLNGNRLTLAAAGIKVRMRV